MKLELKLSNMNVGLWQGLLKSNVESTTHAFSLQGTETTDFSEPETRWAYTAVYTPVHASIMYDTVASFSCNDVPSLKSAWEDEERYCGVSSLKGFFYALYVLCHPLVRLDVFIARADTSDDCLGEQRTKNFLTKIITAAKTRVVGTSARFVQF